MQYILSEEEMKKLREAATKLKVDHEKKLQKFCTRIANELPVDWGWGGNDLKPWTCILSNINEWYCDSCPCVEVCHHPHKEWSK